MPAPRMSAPDGFASCIALVAGFFLLLPEPASARQDAPAPVDYSLSEPPLVTIGGRDDRPDYLLQYAVGALRLSDGRMVVADAGPRELRYFDAEGRHLRSVGGSGEGPAEFGNLRSIARMRGDTIVVWDPSRRRVSYFADDGTFVEGVTLTGWSAVHEALLQAGEPGLAVSAYALHVLEDGDVVLEPYFYRAPDAMEETRVLQDSLPLVAFDRTGERGVTIGTFPGPENFVRNRTGSLLRFGERLVLAAAEDVVYVGSTGEPVLRGVSLEGEEVRALRLPLERRPVTPGDLPPPSGDGPIAEHRDAMPVPGEMPYFSDLRRGTDGRLWVQRYVAPLDARQEWLAFDAAGTLLASLTMDASHELLEIGSDYALVLAVDELDVQEVRLHRLAGS